MSENIQIMNEAKIEELQTMINILSRENANLQKRFDRLFALARQYVPQTLLEKFADAVRIIEAGREN